MSIDQKLLHILRCPVTKQKLNSATESELEILNRFSTDQSLKHADGSSVEDTLSAALVTENRQIIYKITNGIPIMLEEQSIPAIQIEDW